MGVPTSSRALWEVGRCTTQRQSNSEEVTALVVHEPRLLVRLGGPKRESGPLKPSKEACTEWVACLTRSGARV
jgi:hypothetical protein